MLYSSPKHFDIIDYIVFGFMLFVSALVGVYFAFFAKVKQNTTAEYLMGGKTMGIFPISMSLIASYISGISLLGLPAEMYVYGTQLWIMVISEVLVSVTMAYLYLPVFFQLQITSSYEYLRLRFNPKVQLLGSCIFLLKQLLYIPIVIYVPALAFSQVTGINLHLVTPITCIVCIFYTTLGGLKAVVWTDTIQTIIMFGAVIIVMILGTAKVGGFANVIKRNWETDRIEFFNFDFDPTVRHTFWTVVIGNFFQWLSSCSVNQAMVQRCLSMSTLAKANKTIFILAVGILAIVSMSCYTGLVIFAMFYQCDPITTRDIRKPDQLLPYFVMNIGGWIPGLPGLFVSGVFSAALSTMSTGLNSMTGVIFEDLIKPNVSENITEGTASFIMKIIVVIIGTVCVGLVFLVEKMGTLIQAAKSMSSITAGPLLGIFSLGMFFPWANATGAIVGGVCGMLITGWISIGTQVAMAQGLIINAAKPVSIDGCDEEWLMKYNSTRPITRELKPQFFLYQISYMYYCVIGMATVLIVGMIVSFVTTPNKPNKMHPDLFCPIIHRYLNKTEISLRQVIAKQKEGLNATSRDQHVNEQELNPIDEIVNKKS